MRTATILAFLLGVAFGAMPFALAILAHRADRWTAERIERFMKRSSGAKQ